MKKKFNFLTILLFTVISCISCSYLSIHAKVKPVTYDISQYQGSINNHQAKNLKNEVKYIILRTKNGKYIDSQFRHNSYEMSRNNIPYGVYENDSYINPAQARAKALNLYRIAPGARFYVNNPVINNAGKSFSLNRFNNSTRAWANEIRYVTHKPAVLYSTLSFMNNMFSQRTRNKYSTLWTADYSMEPNPKWHYDLWQYSNHKYSHALGEYVNASAIPYGGRGIPFWIGNPNRKYIKRHAKHAKKQRIIKKPRMHINYSHKTRKIYKHNNYINHNYISHNYYYSPNIKHLIVVAKNGVNIYDLYSNYVHHFKRGSILHVNRFGAYRYHKNEYHTIALDTYHHKAIMFTANKSVLHPFYFTKSKEPVQNIY